MENKNGKKICHKCGKEIENEGLFCPYCGEEYIEECVESDHEEQKICKACGAELSDDSAFCTYCGASCEDAETYEDNQQENSQGNWQEMNQRENQTDNQDIRQTGSQWNGQEMSQWENPENNLQNGTPVVSPNKKSNGRIALIWSMLLVTFVVVAVVATFIIKSFQGKDSQSTFADSRTESDSSEDESSIREGNVVAQLVDNISKLKDCEEGDIVEFGNYYGNTEWIVLKREGDILTLLSKDCFNQKRYNTEDEDVTWETCSLRKWLNEEYINEAFDGIEQQLIEETVIENPDNSKYGTEGGNDTKDKIFLLSLEEVEEYFTDDESRIAEYLGDTEWWWWLRSPGSDSDDAALVLLDGSVYCDGTSVDEIVGAVRPVFHLNLSNLSNLELKPNLIGTNRKQRDVNQELEQIKNASAGDVVEYGSHLGNTTWKVLKKEDGKALLLAEDAIRYGTYNNERVDITWETCPIRTWLNDTYLNCTFSEQEQEWIVKTYVENKDNPEYGTEGGADTEDYIFLLSLEEAEEYFHADGSRQATNTEGEECCWWLRSPGCDGDFAAGVNRDGSIGYTSGYAGDRVNDLNAIRPALWVNLDS